MSTLTEAARGQPCLLRLPGYCLGDHPSVVAAHLRKAHLAGVAIKPCDLAVIFACDGCHNIIDGRVPMPAELRDDLPLFLLEGLLRTLDNLWRRGVITCA